MSEGQTGVDFQQWVGHMEAEKSCGLETKLWAVLAGR